MATNFPGTRRASGSRQPIPPTAVEVHDVRDYGATPNHATNADQSSFIQAAIDAAIASSGSVLIPSGLYTCNSGLTAFHPTDITDSVTLCIEGTASYPYAGGVTAGTAKLLFTDQDSFGIAIQEGKGLTIRNIQFEGQNDFTFGTPKDLVDANETTGFIGNSSRDNRHSPHAAIAIDPISSGVGAGDQYAGFTTEYAAQISSGGSTMVNIENCRFDKWVVGIGLSLGDGMKNCEQVQIRNCRFNTVKTCISIGQTQNRSVLADSCQFWGYHLHIFDGINYGDGSGGAPNVTNCQIAGGCKYICQADGVAPNVAAASWVGFFMESSYALGVFKQPVKFDGCTFKHSSFTPSNPGGVPDPPTWVANGSTYLSFDGCLFITSTNPPDTRAFAMFGAGFDFNNCVFDTPPFVERTYSTYVGAGRRGPRFRNCWLRHDGKFLDEASQEGRGLSGKQENVTFTHTVSTNTLTFTDTGVWAVGDQIVTNQSPGLYTDDFGNAKITYVGRVSAVTGGTVTMERVSTNIPASGTTWFMGYTMSYVERQNMYHPFIFDESPGTGSGGIIVNPRDELLLQLREATGDETALAFDYSVNKATSGDDYGFKLNASKLGSGSAGDSYLIHLSNDSVVKFSVMADGTLTAVGTATVDGLVVATSTPASASDTGTAGTITWDADYIYVCTATDTWKRVAIATW